MVEINLKKVAIFLDNHKLKEFPRACTPATEFFLVDFIDLGMQ